jgi:ABC-type multidrug transport system fused ATPase/permease subunit
VLAEPEPPFPVAPSIPLDDAPPVDGLLPAGGLVVQAAGPVPVAGGVPAAGVAAVGGLRLDRVLLHYPERAAPALAELSLVVPTGQRLAVLGASGAGKSSLFAVLLRFATPAAGCVTLDGFDLLAAAPAEARRRIAWVPQHPYLFAGTIAENVRLGRPSATPAELDEVAGLVGLDDVLRRLPDGWETPVGERGQRLSAGQRQRLALLLLDEPTAHLDADSAAAVRQAVLDRTVGRTLLVISHDAGWPAVADRVVRLDGGLLTEPADRPPAPRSAGDAIRAVRG